MRSIILFFGITCIVHTINAQSVVLLNADTKSSFRGLSVVNNKIIWVSGSNGTIGKSLDGGIVWHWFLVPGYEKTDFRDIEAFDDKNALIMGIDNPAVLLKTNNGGESWTLVFHDTTKGMFLDAMDFYDNKHGVVIGDPIQNKFFKAITSDGGNTWKSVFFDNRPLADSMEACFASSGTNIRKFNKREDVFISGGLSSNLFIKNKKIKIPIVQGVETSGSNSVAYKNKKYFIIVGGDFSKKNDSVENIAITNNCGKSWIKSTIPPHGYRSCIEHIASKQWITCGLNGVDISKDNGISFSKISDLGFHVCRKAKHGDAVFLAGGGGKIGKLVNY